MRGDALHLILRFLFGGLDVSAVPVVGTKGCPPAVAGVVVLLPIVVLLGFYFLGVDAGATAVQTAAHPSRADGGPRM